MLHLLATPPVEPASGRTLAPDDATTILVVEDDERIRALAKLALGQRGYAVLEAAGFVEATRLWQKNTGAVKLALIDVQLGAGPDGLELAERFRRLDPDVRILMMSGGSLEEVNPGFGALQKPFNVSRLCEAIRTLLAGVPVCGAS